MSKTLRDAKAIVLSRAIELQHAKAKDASAAERLFVAIVKTTDGMDEVQQDLGNPKTVLTANSRRVAVELHKGEVANYVTVYGEPVSTVDAGIEALAKAFWG